jgi:hypothetical protein
MYPVTYEADYVESRNRLSTLLRLIFAIPVLIVAMLYSIALIVTVPVAWLALVFTGRYPQGLYDFNAKFVRLSGRANAYLYLATDASPPLHGNPDDSYPVRIGFAPPKPEYSRVKALLRWIIGIPVMLLAYVWIIIAEIVALIGWFAIIFTGKLSEGLFKPIKQGLTYQTRASAYLMLLTEDWPPFAEDEGSGSAQAAAAPPPAAPPPATEPAAPAPTEPGPEPEQPPQ